MRFLSLCSGVEAASLAWEPLGWKAAAFSEIEPFPSAVLAHRWPDVPNLGDMTKHESWNIGPIDLLAGGTPCQAFSVAGQRAGLADARGNLALTYCDIADQFQPEWCVWENVPGVLSSKDNAFGCFLGRLCGARQAIQPGGRWPTAGMVSGPTRTIAWRVLDAQFYGVAQRRRRVFVLAVRGSRNWRCAAALFPVGDGVQWDPAKGGESREAVAALTANGVGTCGADDNQGQAGHLIPVSGQSRDVANCLTSLEGKGADSDATTTLVVAFNTTHITSPGNVSNPRPGQPCHALQSGAHPPAIIPYGLAWQQGGSNPANGEYDLTPTIRKSQIMGVMEALTVRRLTPRECERLQGMPDDHTLIPFRGKPAADSPRYKAIGNSMAVPCMAWIGRRIQFSEANY